MVQRDLLRKNLHLAPSQPATALWRAIETGHLLRAGVLPTEGRGLDLGCGDGAITQLLADEVGAAWQLVGVDPDAGELALAEQRGVFDCLKQAEGDALGEPDASFDFVISNSVLEHVERLEPTLKEASRVLRECGTLVFTVPSQFFRENLGEPGPLGAVATGARSREAYHREIDRRLAHLRYPTVDEWREILSDAGLELVHASFYMSRAETRRWAALSNATAGLLVRLARRRSSPIELQRRMRVRSVKPPLWIRGVGRAVGGLASIGLSETGEATDRASCLLVTARKIGGSS
jgi:SAM-dependent methyltransferase